MGAPEGEGGKVFRASYRKAYRRVGVSQGQQKKEAGWEREVRCSPHGKHSPFSSTDLRIETRCSTAK